MQQQHLPVPPLAQTLVRYLEAVRPLLADEAYRTTQQAVAAFSELDGPACQEALLAFAEEENAQGRSWLADAWLSGYLKGRTPLPLTSNVGFWIRWDSPGRGLDRAADFVQRMGAVHLEYVRGEFEAEVGPRGHALSVDHWEYLAGGLRHPEPDHDRFVDGRMDARGREVGVLYRGQCWAMTIGDGDGRVLPRARLLAALGGIVEGPVPSGPPFAAWSYFGSDRALDYAAALDAGENAATYRRLTDFLFLVNLTEEPGDEDVHLERTTFDYGRAWAYKPVTYQVSLTDDYAGMHVEHSIVDGLTLKAAIARAQALDPDEPDASGAAHSADTSDAAQAPAAEPLAWRLTDDQAAMLDRDIAAYRERAASHRIRTLREPMLARDAIPIRVSHDACQQWVLLYAQLKTYGRLRSTYEAVDMREYQAGRTECLRPNTAEAVTLVTHLLDGRATLTDLYAALDAHKARVKACKSGQGVDRHLFGLAFMADRLGLSPALFADEGFGRLTEDFLSTSSVGDHGQIVRFAFAPTDPAGIGVNYTALDGEYDFCLSYDEAECERVDAFADALREGTDALWQFIATAACGPAGE